MHISYLCVIFMYYRSNMSHFSLSTFASDFSTKLKIWKAHFLLVLFINILRLGVNMSYYYICTILKVLFFCFYVFNPRHIHPIEYLMWDGGPKAHKQEFIA